MFVHGTLLFFFTLAVVCTIDTEPVRIESSTSTISSESGSNVGAADKSEWSLLDLYAGCGAMSTGLCFGASKSGIKLVTVLSLICIKFFGLF
jgi:hypothetical protein